MAVKILTDSTSYIDKQVAKDLDIRIVSLNVIFSDRGYRETDLENDIFYQMMEDKGIPTSSQPTVDELYNEMKKVVENGDSLLCIFLSSDMSGTYATAHTVRNMILDHYKNADIEILDSRSNCMQLGFAAIVAARAAKEGKTLEQVKEAASHNIKRSRFLFIPDNLKYLKKGGRIGGASALLGNLLKIIPILTVENGVTTVLTKVRTKKKAVIIMIDKMLQDAINYGLTEIVIHHINCYDEAEELVSKLSEKIGIEVSICPIGPVIGLHVGPGALGISYYTERDII